MTMDGLTNKFIPPARQNVVREARVKQNELQQAPAAGNFQNALDNAINTRQPVHFSKHANMRLNNRQITLTGEQLSRVEAGLSRANEKGIKDSLVLVDDVALLVNVKSKTVITALNSNQENVFSNIDGAVIV